MAEKKAPRKRNKQGYKHRSNAVCVVAYDPSGQPVSDEVATQIINSIWQTVDEHRLLISFTRT